MNAGRVIVLKLGGSVLRTESDLPTAVHEIYRWHRRGYRVAAVVSAFAGSTERLFAEARAWGEADEVSAVATLVATGERRVAGLLALALQGAGVPASALDPGGVGLATRGDGFDADPVGLDVGRIARAFKACPVLVLPGFTGCDERGAPTLLGRGGSDLTALFLAQRLGARCRLLKDVPGVFARDPKAGRDSGPRFHTLSWSDAAAIGAPVVQPRALELAARHRQVFEVAAPGDGFATRISPEPTATAPWSPPAPLRVALLGLGTVGGGVYERLLDQPERFEVVGAVVVHPERHARVGIPREVLRGDADEVLARHVDVVVEALPGATPAIGLLRRALESGRDVVTANKAALASAGEALWAAARRAGVELRASAAVGGAVPVLETAERLARNGRLTSIHGVLNGTCNFVLDRLEEGVELPAAVAQARRRGIAEADPSADLDGRDAACKLALLARFGFGAALEVGEIRCDGLHALSSAWLRRARARGRRVRQVASLTSRGGRLTAAVRPLSLRDDHFLAMARGEENRVVFLREEGSHVALSGNGAGRRPTAEAVVADLLDLWRLRRAGDTAPEAAVNASTALAEATSAPCGAGARNATTRHEEVPR